MALLPIGSKAPDFTARALVDGEEKNFRLSDNRGKWVILFFYPKDFSAVCPTELRAFRANTARLKELNAVFVAGSTDDIEKHKEWQRGDLGNLPYPHFTDRDGTISKLFGTFMEDAGISTRGTYLIDPEGIVRAIMVTEPKVARSVEETLRLIAAYQTGEACPVDWHPGDPTL
jgi:alkyl hydroperoxide reductase subunit AhpC